MGYIPAWLESRNGLACPNCGGKLRLDRHQLRCEGCGREFEVRDGIPYFVSLNDLDSFEREESEFHSLIAEEADSAHGYNTLRSEYLHHNFLEPIFALPECSIILDVACGSGVDTIKLARKGYYVIGIDIAPGMLRTARRKAVEAGISENVFLAVARASNLPFPDNYFSASTICAALHHMQDPRQVLGEIGRTTCEGGIVSIGSEPNAWIYAFRGIKHSTIGRKILRRVRDDYTVGDQPPGDRTTPGWKRKDWQTLFADSELDVLSVSPIWYLNGGLSALGIKTLPRGVERAICDLDRFLSHIPYLKEYSFKWNVIARKGKEVAD